MHRQLEAKRGQPTWQASSIRAIKPELKLTRALAVSAARCVGEYSCVCANTRVCEYSCVHGCAYSHVRVRILVCVRICARARFRCQKDNKKKYSAAETPS